MIILVLHGPLILTNIMCFNSLVLFGFNRFYLSPQSFLHINFMNEGFTAGLLPSTIDTISFISVELFHCFSLSLRYIYT